MLFLSPGSWFTWNFTWALQEWSLYFPQSYGSSLIKSCWLSKSDSLGIPHPFARSPSWEVWRGVQNLHSSGRISLVLLFSSLWVTHPLLWLCPSYHFIIAAPLSLDVEYLFLVGSSVLSMMLQMLVAISVLFQEEASTWPSTPLSWTNFLKVMF